LRLFHVKRATNAATGVRVLSVGSAGERAGKNGKSRPATGQLFPQGE
jgi:hypothetical protein